MIDNLILILFFKKYPIILEYLQVNIFFLKYPGKYMYISTSNNTKECIWH